MATANQSQSKKIEYKKVDFDVSEIAPDAPAGEWKMSIPRGKCKVQPTAKDHFPMIIVPIRLDGTDEEDDNFTKALGTELSVFLVFGGATPAGERMAKMRIRELCEAADVDLDLIPKKLGADPDSELQPFIKAIEGKKFTGWTKITKRKDTGEETTEVTFRSGNKLLAGGNDDDDDDADDGGSNGAQRGKKKTSRNKGNGSKSR